MPKISVIIPNYNHSEYLNQRIDSVLSQTYQDFEIIILDDCSKDNSREIIDQYRNHPKVSHIVYNEINSGSTFKQWEKGIELAKGELIWIAESDDWCEPPLLETLVNAFKKNEQLSLGFVQSYYMLGNNKIKWISIKNELELTLDGSEFIKKYLSNGNSIFNASMAIFKKEYYYFINKEYSNYKFCGDWFFWTELASKGNVFISGKILNYFRNHERDVSGKAYQTGLNFIEEFKVLEHLFAKKKITEDIFFNSILDRYIKYRNVRTKFSVVIKCQIESQFYNNIHTNSYRHNLIIKYFTYKISKKIEMLFKKPKFIK